MIFTAKPPQAGVYYTGIYWNNHKVVRDHLSSCVSGDSGTGWIQYFANTVGRKFKKALFLNCGNGWVERDFLKYDIFDEAVGLDCSEELLGQAQALTDEKGLPLRYYKVDINDAEFIEDGFDLVVNHAAAHHITLIDKVFRKICDTLTPEGVFLSYDYVGPHRNQYTLDAWQRLWEINNQLPQELRHPSLRYPHYPSMLRMDPTEAIHSELIKDMFFRYFHCDKWVPLGGAIAYPLLTHNSAMNEAPEDVSNSWVKIILDKDIAYLEQDPVSTLFAFFHGRPNKAVLSDCQALSSWQEQELAREAQATINGGRYYPTNIVADLYERLERLRVLASRFQADLNA